MGSDRIVAWHLTATEAEMPGARLWCRYYGIPSLSWRDAAYHLMVANATDFGHEQVYYDNGHPNGRVGHRCNLRSMTTQCDAAPNSCLLF